MLRLHYRTAALLALGLLAAGGAGGYFLHRENRPAGPPDQGAAALPRPNQPSGPESPSGEGEAVRARPPVVVVVAAYPGATPEEVERQVTVPLEVSLAGVPGLESLGSKSLPASCALYLRFKPETPETTARQEVINRLAMLGSLPPGVTPVLAPALGGDALRYLLVGPRDPSGRPVYTASDLRALQDWLLERKFRRLSGVADVSGTGGTVRRFEVQPDPDRLQRYGITLSQLQAALADSPAALVGGDYIPRGGDAPSVRQIGLLGGGDGPLPAAALAAARPEQAARLLRGEEKRCLRDIRSLVIASVNNQPVTIDDIVEGGRPAAGGDEGRQGVVVGHLPRVDWVASSGPGVAEEADTVQGVVLMRPGEDARLLDGVRARIRELNTTAGRLLPGVRIEPFHATADGGEGTLWVYGTFPVNTPRERTAAEARKVRAVLRQLPEVERVVSQVGGDTQSPHQAWFYVGLKAGRAELPDEIHRRLSRELPGVAWLVMRKSPAEVDRAFPGVPAENLVKIIGPDLAELERLADGVRAALATIPGVEDVAAYHCRGLTQLEFRVDPQKCAKWGVRVADINLAISAALEAPAGRGAVEANGFDITIRWPKRLRDSETSILDIPIDVINNQVAPGVAPGPDTAPPAPAGNPIGNTPRLGLRDLVVPVGQPDGEFVRVGASTIYREQGKRFLPVRFGVRGRPLAEVRAEAGKKIAPLLKPPYQIEWGPP